MQALFGSQKTMRVSMTLPKAVGCMAVILVMYYGLVFSKELMGQKVSLSRPRRMAALDFSDYLLEAVISTSDLEHLRTVLSTLSLPVLINNSAEIISIDTTTICSSNMTEYQCRCEQNFAWSYNTCITRGACDAITGDTCGCINALPDDGQYCQPNNSQTGPVAVDIVLELRIPLLSVPTEFLDQLRQTLMRFPFPYPITQSLNVESLVFTTGCYPNNNGGTRCQCEEQFSWSCDKCNVYGSCDNVTGQTCGCINGFPSDGQFCNPITNITQCPTTTPEVPTTPMTPTQNTTMMTTPMTPTQNTTMMTTPMTPTQNTTMMTTPMTPTQNTTMMTTPMTPTQNTTMMTTPMTPTQNTTMMTTPMTPTQNTTMMTTPMTPRPTLEERRLSFAMDLVFQPSYNNPESTVYQNTNNAIQRQCQQHISNFETARITEFRSGSTVVDYIVIATSIQDTEIQDVERAIFSQLGEIYPILFDAQTPLQFNPSQVFFGFSLTVTCGPPPATLNFSDSWIAEWKRNDSPIREDSEHSFLRENGASVLTVRRVFTTDNGLYECRLKDDTQVVKNVFRQRSNGQFVVKPTPLIRVTPVRQKVGCEVGREVQLRCNVDSPYTVEFQGVPDAGTGDAITHQFSIPNCDELDRTFTCQETTFPQFSARITLELSTENFVCVNDDVYGDGVVGDRAVAPCKPNEVGEKTAVCEESGNWEVRQENCILRVVNELLQQSQNLNNNSLPGFLEQLSNVTVNFISEVVESPANINAIVEILNNVANASSSLFIPITITPMKNILVTAGILSRDDAKESWDILNANDTTNMLERRSTVQTESVSSTLLQSLETLTSRLINDSLDIDTPLILLNRTTFSNSFNAEFNSSVAIDIPQSDGETEFITVITFASMDNILPARDEDNSTSNVINGRVVLVQSTGTISNVSFTFDILNDTLRKPQCVFWNFSLFEGLGGWDSEGCELVFNVNQTGVNVTCNCNHLTSFSILMSPSSPDDSFLKVITYVGVGISMASLVICLIIEAIIWRKIRRNNTSYLRHVSIVNIAVSLLIANIWFIIGAAISAAEQENPPACSAATFFIHFFYLALFFWMLASALLLLYRTVSVFGTGLSKASMLAIGFSLGYGAPLIIAIITIAVTAPKQQYIREARVCWLNWDESKALLAFVIPVLLIVFINLLILLLVLYKMLRRRTGDAAHAGEKHVLVVIARTLAILTPFFGLTWGLGVGILVDPDNRGIHIAFAFFNSLQGFFILLFGTLLDKKVLSELALTSQTSRSGTGNTSGGLSSSSGLSIFQNWRRRRGGYNISSSTSGTTHSMNT